MPVHSSPPHFVATGHFTPTEQIRRLTGASERWPLKLDLFTILVEGLIQKEGNRLSLGSHSGRSRCPDRCASYLARSGLIGVDE